MNLESGALHSIQSSANAYPTGNIHFHTCKMTTEISSLTAYPVVCDIYELVAKHDLSCGAYSKEQIISPVALWDAGLSAAINSSLGYAINSNTVNSFSTDSEYFNNYLRVSARFRVMINSSSVHVHESSYNLSKTLNGRRYINASLLGGITRSVMIVLQGTPIRDTNKISSVGTGGGVINVTHQITYKARVFPNSSRISNYTPYQPVIGL